MKSLLQYINESKILKGVNINCKVQDFVDEIFSHKKTIETRNTPSLNCVVGQRVAIIRTGKGNPMIVGYGTIEAPIQYNSTKQFNNDYKKHLVAKDSPFHISKSPNGVKYGYPISNVKKLKEEIPCNSKGYVIRNIDLEEL